MAPLCFLLALTHLPFLFMYPFLHLFGFDVTFFAFTRGLDTAGAGLPRPENVALPLAPSRDGTLGGP